jgi:hypothetical protein
MDDTGMPSLQAMFDAAKCFGLADHEAWQTLDDCIRELGNDATVGELMDELVVALTQGVLAKQRGEPRAAERPPARRPDHRGG